MCVSKLYIAYLLLVLFINILAPDAFVLALHEYTEHAAVSDLTVSKPLVHCEMGDPFNSSFLAPNFSLNLTLVPQFRC